MIKYTTAESDQELEAILDLQAKNLRSSLSVESAVSQGYVSVQHDFELLKKLNQTERHIIAKDGEKVIAYTLSMTKVAKDAISILVPMFKLFEQLNFKGKSVAESNYMVIGQICIDENYRGQGIFDEIYAYYKTCYRHKYDFAVTEILLENTRSLKAHQRVGFIDLQHYTTHETDWIVVLWDWESALKN